ncbi:hypothetical protein EG327_002442 [Venturia inaequalis]|uniref:Extracellular serine-rich protein n=1 Tax=Venturia inaequalis TaxID=5025 RepID=A0A8H3VJP4_VENIN|nr:hypothetical protein EG327_002442 [Venturia inaequalis]
MLSTISIAFLSALTLVQAAPFTEIYTAGATAISSTSVYKPTTVATSTSTSLPSKVKPSTGATHTVIAGLGGLHFDPENIVAEIGDNIEVHFRPQNHSFAQSSFSSPCKPLLDAHNYESGFFSGFMPTTSNEAPNVFTVDVVNKDPIWFYCSQTKGSHCQAGMAGVVNQNFDGPNTLAAYKKAAALTGTSVSPMRVQGGVVAPPKNP